MGDAHLGKLLGRGGRREQSHFLHVDWSLFLVANPEVLLPRLGGCSWPPTKARELPVPRAVNEMKISQRNPRIPWTWGCTSCWLGRTKGQNPRSARVPPPAPGGTSLPPAALQPSENANKPLKSSAFLP